MTKEHTPFGNSESRKWGCRIKRLSDVRFTGLTISHLVLTRPPPSKIESTFGISLVGMLIRRVRPLKEAVPVKFISHIPCPAFELELLAIAPGRACRQNCNVAVQRINGGVRP
jgi:hypothetical protein